MYRQQQIELELIPNRSVWYSQSINSYFYETIVYSCIEQYLISLKVLSTIRGVNPILIL